MQKGTRISHRPSPEQTEAQLRAWLLASLDGDTESYKKFLNRVAGIVSSFIAKALNPTYRSNERVEELVQDVLLSIHAKRTTYRPEMRITPWIYAIARYRLIDSIRYESRRPETVGWEDRFDEVLDDRVWIESPSESSLAMLDRDEVSSLLAGLSGRQRQVLFLAKIDNVPLAEIATQMNMSLSAVKVTVHRALHTLRKRVEHRDRQ